MMQVQRAKWSEHLLLIFLSHTLGERICRSAGWNEKFQKLGFGWEPSEKNLTVRLWADWSGRAYIARRERGYSLVLPYVEELEGKTVRKIWKDESKSFVDQLIVMELE